MSIQKKNDWAITLFFNPEKSLEDLANYGITTENSDIKDREYYKSYPEIQAYFTEDGKFNEVKFNNFYNSALSLYNSEDAKNVESKILNTYEYDSDDILAPIGSKIRNYSPRIVKYANPTRSTRGVANLNRWGSPTMSEREVAQTRKVFNTETGEFENWTPNDLNIFSHIKAPTLVLAKWEEDGVHVENGIQVKHYKGQSKYDSEGDPYYETLGKRSVDGKEVLHGRDILTVDGSKWNKYDFFDSDGLDKSVIGSVFDTVVKVAPAFIPYANIGYIYTALNIAKDLGKLLPVMYKSIHGIATNDNSDDKVGFTNEIQGWFSKFDSSTSDKSREGFWNIENILNIASSSSLQLKSQRLIGELPKIINGGKESLKTIQLGRALSLSYMVGTSSTQSYEAFKNAGASDAVAGLGTLATMLAMKTLMDNDYFRDFWYNGTGLSKAAYNKAIKKASDQIVKEINIGVNSTPKEKAKFILEAQEKIVNIFKGLNKGELFSGALNEGLEETGEEFASDMVKGAFSALHSLGLVDKSRSYDFGFSSEDIASRYSASFFGGAIGGTIFKLQDKVTGFNNKTANDSGNDPWFKEIVYMVRNGRSEELKNQLRKKHEKGELASAELSAIDSEFVKDSDKISINFKQAKIGESQNDIVYNQVLNLINRIEGILNEENLKISDEDLDLIRSASPELSELDNESLAWSWKQRISNYRAEKLIEDKDIVSKIYQDWNDLSQDILSTKLKMEEMLKPQDNASKTPKDLDSHIASIIKTPQYLELQSKLNDLREKRDSILLGHKNDYYYGQMQFSLNPELAKIYGAIIGVNNFSKELYGKKYNELTVDEKRKVDELYDEYTKSNEKDQAYKAYDIFRNISERFSKKINDTAEGIFRYTSLFEGGNTEYSRLKKIYEYNIRIAEEELENAKNNSDLDKIPSAEQKLSQAKEDLLRLNNSISIQTTRRIGHEGQGILNRTEDKSRIDNYVLWLKYLKENDLFIEPDDADLYLVLNQIADYIENNNNEFESYLLNKINSYYGPGNEYVGDNLRGVRSEAIEHLRNGDIKSFIDDINNAYNDEFVEDSETNEVDEEFIDLIFGKTIHGNRIVDLIKEIYNIRSSMKVSPVYDLLQEIAVDINPELEGIVDLVLNDIKRISYLNSLEDYIINDKRSIDNLKTLLKIIDIADSLIYAGNDLNEDINQFRVDNPLIVISDQVRETAKYEFKNIYNKVERLIEITESNGRQKLREQKDIMMNMRRKFGDILTSKDSIIKDSFAKIFNINIDELIESSGVNNIDITEDNYSQYESAIIKFEDAIYSEIRNKNLNQDQVVSNIISLFKWDELLHRKPTKMNKDQNNIISDYDKAVYLLSIISSPSSDFYNKLKTILDKPEFKIAPIYSQEYIAKVAYSFLNYPELLNEFLRKLNNIAYDNEIDLYLKNKPSLYNVVSIISGGAGSGKTNGVDRIIYEMIKDDSDVICCAPTENQAKILKTALNHNGKYLSKNEFISSILGRNFSKNDYELLEKEKVFSLKPNINVRNNNIFGNKNRKILFIDEYSLFSKPELQLITKWAVENDVLIILSGDNKQNKAMLEYKINDEIMYGISGVEDFIALFTPELTTSLRADNLAKLENYNNVNSVLIGVYDKYYSDQELESEDLSREIHDKTNVHPIILKYFESKSSFGGEKFIPESDIEKYVDKLKSLSDNIAIITDTPEKYSKYGIKIVELESVQGDEFDYVIIDKDWRFNAKKQNQDIFNMLSDFYALTQRSTKGSIIIKRALAGIRIENHQDDSTSSPVVMTDDQVSSFKELRLSGLSNIDSENLVISKFDTNDLKKAKQISEKRQVILPPIESENKQEEIENISNVSSPITEQTRSIVTNNDQKYELIETISGRVLKEHYHNIKKIFSKSVEKVKALNSIRGQKINGLYLGLSSYYKYGHYKNSDTDRLRSYLSNIIKNKRDIDRILSSLKGAKLYYIPYSYNNKNTSAISAILKFGEDELIIPLLISNKAVSERVPFEGNISADFSNFDRDNSSSNGESTIQLYNNGQSIISDVFGEEYSVIGDPMILSKHDDENFFDKVSKTRFYKDNVGKTMLVISSDPLLTEDDLYLYVKADKNSLFTITDKPGFRLIGVNKHVNSSEGLYELVSKLSGKNNYNILSTETLAKLFSELYKLDNDIIISKLINQIFVNNPDWYININGSDTKYNSKSELQNIDWINISKIEFKREVNGTVYNIDTSIIIKDLLETRFDGKKYKDDKLIYLINNIINNSQEFIHGIKLNDKIIFGSQVGGDSMWYNIQDKNNVVYSTDIIEMYEPDFKVISRSNESTAPTENNVEQKVEMPTIIENPVSISEKIKSILGNVNIEFIADSESENWKTKLIFVTSQSSSGFYKISNIDNITENTIELISDPELISNIDVIRSYLNSLKSISGYEILIENIIRNFNNAINLLTVNPNEYNMVIEGVYDGTVVSNAIDELLLSDKFCII